MSVGADNLGSGDLPRTSIIYFTLAKEQEVAFLVVMMMILILIIINLIKIWIF